MDKHYAVVFLTLFTIPAVLFWTSIQQQFVPLTYFNHLIPLEIFGGVLERVPSALQISILLPKGHKRIKLQIP